MRSAARLGRAGKAREKARRQDARAVLRTCCRKRETAVRARLVPSPPARQGCCLTRCRRCLEMERTRRDPEREEDGGPATGIRWTRAWRQGEKEGNSASDGMQAATERVSAKVGRGW